MMAGELAATALRFLRENARASDLAVAAAALFVLSAIRNHLSTKPPGAPTMWPVLGIIPALLAHSDNIYDWATTALTRCNGTFHYRGTWGGGSSGIITSSPANVEHVLKTNFANYPKGPYYRERFAELLGGGIFNADGDAWSAQRAAAAAVMHSARFREFSAGVVGDMVRRKLVPLLDRVVERGEVVDLQDVLLRFAFDNICAVALGIDDAGCLTAGAEGCLLPDVPFAAAFEKATELSLARFVTPPFVWKVKRRLGVGSEWKLAEAARAVREFAERAVAQRRREIDTTLASRYDLLSQLMLSPRADLPGGGGYSDEFLRDFCISFILAGRDTSSVALVWFFWLLASHPDVESRVVADAADAGESTMDDDYLHAALTESMRLYPPVPADFKETVEDDVLPDGTPMRAGQRVIYFPYAMGRDEALWGSDCLEFRPERWLDKSGGGESPYKYVVFHGGPRLCLGKRFAYAQMKAVASAVLARFRVEVLPGQEEAVKPKLNTTLYMKHGLKVRFARRDELAAA